MVIPKSVDFETWAASVVIDFPTDNIPLFTRGMDWKTWGNWLTQNSSFQQNGIPGTSNFEEPMEWAMAVYKQMVNNS